jgi:Kae1-associated kinase Bud32
MKTQLIAQGAEAIIYLDNDQIIKDRIKKSYRLKEIDEKLRKSRTKSETKILQKLEKIIPVPKVIKSNEKEKLILEYIEGKKLSDNLEKLDYKILSKKISENISEMHDKDIIHGDLTTSNMILNEKNNEIYFIDFGLSFHSGKIEDKAVDLHLLKQALNAKHFTICEECWKIILDNYNANKNEEIVHRIKVIESRGRYKEKY